MSKKMLLPLATGFEEIEFVSTADILRRAGVEVIVASLDEELLVDGAHGLRIWADCVLESVNFSELDGIALAGGYKGMLNLKANERILSLIKQLHKEKKLVAAICASPIVLNEAGIFEDKDSFACYPSCETGLKGSRIDKAIFKKDNVITSAGPATATLFALEILSYLCGEEARKNLEEELLLPLLAKSLS